MTDLKRNLTAAAQAKTMTIDWSAPKGRLRLEGGDRVSDFHLTFRRVMEKEGEDGGGEGSSAAALRHGIRDEIGSSSGQNAQEGLGAGEAERTGGVDGERGAKVHHGGQPFALGQRKEKRGGGEEDLTG